MAELTHVDAAGAANMVDVGAKAVTRREAKAAGVLRMSEAAFALVAAGNAPKGDVFAAARLAGIAAAKRTAEWIPLCHVLPLERVAVDFACDAAAREVICTVTAAATAKTGVEMEAMVGVSAALLTLYDMVKAVDRGMVMGEVRLLSKCGGARGAYVRDV